MALLSCPDTMNPKAKLKIKQKNKKNELRGKGSRVDEMKKKNKIKKGRKCKMGQVG